MRIRSCFCAQMLESSISISLIRIKMKKSMYFTSLKYIDLIYFVDLLSLSDRSISREVYQAKYITIKMLWQANESSVPVWSRARCSFIRAWASYLYLLCMYTIHVPITTMRMERRRQSANANVKLHTWWYLSFVSWTTSTRAPKEFIF